MTGRCSIVQRRDAGGGSIRRGAARLRGKGFIMEGKRSWWIGRASNPVGGAMRRRVGSTPMPFRHRLPAS